MIRRAPLLLLLLCGLGAAPPDVPKLTKALESGDEKSRIAAIDALGQLGPEAKGAVAGLTKLLGDRSPRVRAHAAHALQHLGPAAVGAAPALVKATGDSDPNVRREAVMALYYIRADHKMSLPVLAKALEDSDPSVRVAALDELTSIGEPAVPVLTKALEKPAVRYWAVLALGELGDKAAPAVDALIAALKDDRAETRREVLVTLARIGPDAAKAVPAITPLLNDQDKAVAHAAVLALGRMGPAAASAVDAVRQLRKTTKDELMKTVSAWALAHIEPTNEAARRDAIAQLTEALQAENPRVQSAALKGLVELEPDPARLVPILAGVLCQGEKPLVDEAFAAVAAMGDAATPALVEALKNPGAVSAGHGAVGPTRPQGCRRGAGAVRGARRSKSRSPPRGAICLGGDGPRSRRPAGGDRQGVGRSRDACAGHRRLCAGLHWPRR